ncbi:MAG: hypothetical protein IPK00_00070 [Deltaproteobacteria bacterium]|nr:hypothetical protein [Deltaproteobacteria bacterium]
MRSQVSQAVDASRAGNVVDFDEIGGEFEKLDENIDRLNSSLATPILLSIDSIRSDDPTELTMWQACEDDVLCRFDVDGDGKFGTYDFTQWLAVFGMSWSPTDVPEVPEQADRSVESSAVD